MDYAEQRRIYAQNLGDSQQQPMQEQPRLVFGFEGAVLTIAPQTTETHNGMQVMQSHNQVQHIPQQNIIPQDAQQIVHINEVPQSNLNNELLQQVTGDQNAQFWCSLCNRIITGGELINLGLNSTSYSRTKLSNIISRYTSASTKSIETGTICRPCHNLLEQTDSLEIQLDRVKRHIQKLIKESHYFNAEADKKTTQYNNKEDLEDDWDETESLELSDDENDPDITLSNLRGSVRRKTARKANKIQACIKSKRKARGRPPKQECEDDIPPGESTQNCPSCDKVVMSCNFMYHLSTHRMFQCPFCSEVYKKKEITIHMAEFHQSEPCYPCRDCDSTFKTFSQLSHHYTSIHFGKDTERYSCNLCKRNFASSSGRKVHVDTIHSKSQVYECPICKETFNQKGNMQSHMRRLHQDSQTKKLQCNTCSKRFICPSDLRKHVERVHLKLDNNKVTCDLCSKSFSDSRAMKVHVNAVHTKTIQYPCPECKMVFHSSTNMASHRRRMHTGLEGRKHVCHICSKGFCSPSDLRTHLKVVHENIRKYICDICGQSFKVASHLKYHRRRHTGETPYKCPHCTKSFHGPSHIADHVKKVHKTVYIGVNQRRRLNLPENAPPPPPGILSNKDQKVKNILMQNLEPTVSHGIMPIQQNHMVDMDTQLHNYQNTIQIEPQMVVRVYPDVNY